MKQTLKYIYGIVYENMKFAESKHSIVLTFSGAVTAFATTFFGDNLVQNMLAAASIIFSFIAILYSFVALVARKVRLKKRKIKQVYNLIFYKDLMHFNSESLVTEIKKQYNFTNIYKADKMDFDLASSIVATSRLAYIKFLYFNFAILFLTASIISIILTVLYKGGVIV